MYALRRLRSACASSQSEQSFHRLPDEILDQWLSTECILIQVFTVRTCLKEHFLNLRSMCRKTGPSCSKLTMSLVKVSLKFSSLKMAYTLIFLLKNVFAKATHIFSAKITELDIVLTRTDYILTTNELVMVMMLWTTGPWFYHDMADIIISLYRATLFLLHGIFWRRFR